MIHTMPLIPQPNDETQSKTGQPVVLLSKSMEKSFLSLKNTKAREAYVEAELVNGLAHQIRIIRQQRGWSQKELAKRVGTTQTTISRLEDPSYGKYSIRTLLALGKVFDVALFVRYMQFSQFMPATWDTRPEHFKAIAFEDEVASIQFYTLSKFGAYTSQIAGTIGTVLHPWEVVGGNPVGILSDGNVIKTSSDLYKDLYKLVTTSTALIE